MKKSALCTLAMGLLPALLILWISTALSQWIPTGGPATTRTVGPFAAVPSTGSTVLLAGTSGGGVYRSLDSGATWIPVDSGMVYPWIEEFLVRPGDPRIFVATGGDPGIYLSTDLGVTWTPRSTGLPRRPYLLAANGMRMFTGADGYGLYVSSDGGLVWTPSNAGLTDSTPNRLLVLPDSGIPAGAYLFLATSTQVFWSTDNGDSWRPRNTTGLLDGARFIITTADSNAVGGRRFLAPTVRQGVCISTDFGLTWQERRNILFRKAVYEMVEHPGPRGSTIFATTNIFGFCTSSDDGETWTPRNEGFNGVVPWSLFILEPFLYAGTMGDGVWKRPLSEIVTAVDEAPTDLPSGFRLEQNFPNPFNPRTTIRFEIPMAAHVRLAVFNTLGQVVATLVDGQRDAGSHTAHFDGSQQGSGVYLVRLQAGEHVGSRRMVLLR